MYPTALTHDQGEWISFYNKLIKTFLFASSNSVTLGWKQYTVDIIIISKQFKLKPNNYVSNTVATFIVSSHLQGTIG